jgi:hypothetical protein
MKKILTAGMVLFFLAATSGLVSAQGITPPTTTKTAKSSKKGHGCHGKKCNKSGSNSSTSGK